MKSNSCSLKFSVYSIAVISTYSISIMSNTHLKILAILCYCCLLPVVIHKRHERQIRAGDRRHRAGKPRDLQLYHRQRRISVSLLGNSEESQPNCRLLTSLPAEIRNMIWLECLGGVKFHLSIGNQRVQQCQCFYSGPELCREPRRCAHSRYSNEVIPAQKFLSLVLSCRQV
jgi:hypothetical protein